jgi:hypothetical protein
VNDMKTFLTLCLALTLGVITAIGTTGCTGSGSGKSDKAPTSGGETKPATPPATEKAPEVTPATPPAESKK